MEINTPRLAMFPLSWKEIELLVNDIKSFQDHVGFYYDGEEFTPQLKSIFLSSVPKLKNPSNLFETNTFWMIVYKKTSTIIGSICFKGNPNELNQCEVGYGISSKFHNHGFMTEALSAFTQFGFTKLHLSSIVASTLNTNIASQRVLIKNGFKRFKVTNRYHYFEKNGI